MKGEKERLNRITDAFNQIKVYEKKIPELYKYVQIGVATNAVAKYFPIVPEQKEDEIPIYEWKVKDKDSVDSTIEMLSPETLLNIVRNYLFVRQVGVDRQRL